MLLEEIVVVWSVCQAAYWCGVAWLTQRHFARAMTCGGEAEPRVAVLKPLCGCEPTPFERFASFCRQTYRDYAVLFGAPRAEDPAAQIVRRLQRICSDRDIQLHVGRVAGINPKVRLLTRLVQHADADIVMISDSDVQASPEYVRRMAQPLASEKVGLVICPYVITEPRTLTDRLESLRLACEFMPSVILAQRCGVPVGLGAAMAFRRRDLEALGGFAAFSDYLLEDERLADAIQRSGKSIELLPDVVQLCAPGITFRQSVRREIRWGRGIRVTAPLRYLGVGFVYALPVLVLALLAGTAWAYAALAALLVLRTVAMAVACRAQGVRTGLLEILLLPLRDALSFCVWCGSLVGRRIVWRGERFYLLRDGRLSEERPAGRIGATAGHLVRALDARLRRRLGIFEFSDDPQCVLRVQRGRAQRSVRLAPGIVVEAGDPLGELHLWNEQIPRMKQGASLLWSLRTRRLVVASLKRLAEAAERDPRLRDVRAYYARSALAPRAQGHLARRVFQKMGFEVRPPPPARGFAGRSHEFLENALIWALGWTFNRRSLAGKPFRRPRMELWMSREVLLANYLNHEEPAVSEGVGR